MDKTNIVEKDSPKHNFFNKKSITFAEEIKERKYLNRRNIGYFFLGAVVAIVGGSVSLIPFC